ncbi:hypothetical protein CCDG5_1150 [[Clostridium] cellulosi]|jgi:Zinc carboxypeptidase.|uniref:Peptidase M14 domain-containing protein n=1 Tax=[Clostridium] cellulosi TaxID=29343 RepID=A0A078KP08_9FIRM|nr:MAG: hypothetical protein DIU81_07395 [[Clostridium] cellulosi]CDZ24267.1 hypothetical protein CCDG5_1150 [[Clostridium] cellulosi]
MSLYKSFFSFGIVVVSAIIVCFLLYPLESTGEKPNKKVQTSTLEYTPKTILTQDTSIEDYGQIVYGKSGLGADLVCTKISPTNVAKHKVLMGFEIHGYEDLAPKDGQVLVKIGNQIADYFKNNRDKLGNTELYIISSLNPDGLSNGKTNNGIGRCQVSLGVDMNRDFDYCFKVYNQKRNHTLKKPFATPETQALKELVESLNPDVVIDCHGWGNMFIGDASLAKYFKDSLKITSQRNFTSSNHGYFSAWATTTGAKGMLIEYPKKAYSHSEEYANRTIEGIKKLVKSFN